MNLGSGVNGKNIIVFRVKLCVNSAWKLLQVSVFVLFRYNFTVGLKNFKRCEEPKGGYCASE